MNWPRMPIDMPETVGSLWPAPPSFPVDGSQAHEVAAIWMLMMHPNFAVLSFFLRDSLLAAKD
jgi:hypothetical protein